MTLYKPLLLSLIICAIHFGTSAQDQKYARGIIDTLCAPAFEGRGYVNQGDALAANFLKDEFKKNGALPMGNSYFQDFHFPVNAILGKVHLSIDNKSLTPGEDYLVAPSSASGSGNVKTVTLTINNVLEGNWADIVKSSKRKALVFDLDGMDALNKMEKNNIHEFIQYLKFESNIQPKLVVIHHHKKVPWSVSTVQSSRPVFLLTTADIPDEFKKISYQVEARFYENYKGSNVVGYIEGTKTPDSTIFITAHYDHLGAMGKGTYFPGANDNASGVAMMLNLMQHYQNHPPEYTVVFIAFGAEEAGLIGSKHFVENPLFPLDNIKFLINIDLVGTGSEGITVVNGNVFESQFNQLKQINGSENLLPEIKARGAACNSDHCFFYKKGVPSFFIYARGGTQAYHDIYDVPATLPLTEYEDIFTLIQEFVDRQ